VNHPGLPPELAKRIGSYTGMSDEQVEQAIVSQWTSVVVSGTEYPILLTRQPQDAVGLPKDESAGVGLTHSLDTLPATPDGRGGTAARPNLRIKYVATIYRSGLDSITGTFAELTKPGLYWRGESYLGMDEALRNATAAMDTVPQIEEGAG
jgi:hypothetical protein